MRVGFMLLGLLIACHHPHQREALARREAVAKVVVEAEARCDAGVVEECVGISDEYFTLYRDARGPLDEPPEKANALLARSVSGAARACLLKHDDACQRLAACVRREGAFDDIWDCGRNNAARIVEVCRKRPSATLCGDASRISDDKATQAELYRLACFASDATPENCRDAADAAPLATELLVRGCAIGWADACVALEGKDIKCTSITAGEAFSSRCIDPDTWIERTVKEVEERERACKAGDRDACSELKHARTPPARSP